MFKRTWLLAYFGRFLCDVKEVSVMKCDQGLYGSWKVMESHEILIGSWEGKDFLWKIAQFFPAHGHIL